MAKMKEYKLKMSPELTTHYKELKKLLQKNDVKNALKYLTNLPNDVYDQIVERSCKNGKFRSIFFKIETNLKKSDLQEYSKALPDLQTSIF